MTDFSTVKKNLETRGFQVSTFQTAAEAADYLNAAMDGVSVGFGGSITLDQMGLYEKLRTHNDVVWHWKTDDKLPARYRAMTTDMYVTSVNGLAETGELVNIDGIGNRVAGTLFGHRKVWFVVGRNKLAPTYEEALWRCLLYTSHRRYHDAAPQRGHRHLPQPHLLLTGGCGGRPQRGAQAEYALLCVQFLRRIPLSGHGPLCRRL